MRTSSTLRSSLVRFRVTRIIVHDIPSTFSNPDVTGPVYSEIEPELTDPLRTFFTERMRDNLGAIAVDVQFQAGDHVFPPLIQGLLSDSTGDFVARSQLVAQHLFDAQYRRSTPGVLVVVVGAIGSTIPCIGFLKLERQNGVQIAENTDSDGKRTFDVLAVENLMLTQKMKVFKAAIFSIDSDWGPHVVGLVSDLQSSRKSGIADFFLDKFLGCQRTEAADVATERVFNAVSTWIDKTVESPERQVQCHLDLTSQMASNASTFSPLEFAEDHLQGTERASMIRFLAERNISEAPIFKRTTLIDHKLRKLRIEHASGIQVIGSADAMADQVSVEDGDDGNTKTVIRDRIQRVFN